MIKQSQYTNRLGVKIILIAAFSLIVSWIGCSHCFAESNKVVMVLFDLSGSTANDRTRRAYLKDFRTILDIVDVRENILGSFIKPGDVLMADIISDNSVGQSSFPIQKEFPRFSTWQDNRLYFGKKVRFEKEGVLQVAEKILLKEDRKIMNTDIFSALHVSERVFKTFHDRKAILIIMSDMLEQSREYDFTMDPLSENRIIEIIRKQKGRGLPDLKGVTVYVTGARS